MKSCFEMEKKYRFSLLIFFCLVFASVQCSKRGGHETEAGLKFFKRDSYNVILITIDTLRADFVGCIGGGKTTPNIDKLAKMGAVFRMCITAEPSTGPSIAAIHTGQYPYKNRVRFNAQPVPGDAFTLSRGLRRLGYETAGFVSTSILSEGLGFGLGFDYFSDRTSRNYSPDDYERTADEVNDEVVPWLRARDKRKPLFLWVHYFDPHAPYTAHYGAGAGESYDQKFLYPLYKNQDVETIEKEYPRIVDFYSQEIFFTDQHIGKLMNALVETGHFENSIVIFTADHGEELFDHDNFYGHVRSLYNTVLNVPLVVVLPGREWAGTEIDAVVRTIDVFPTVFDVIGDKIPQTAMGKSLLPLIFGDEKESRVALTMREPFEYFWEGIGNAITAAPWKFIAFEKEKSRLFNLEKDFYEKNDLIDVEPAAGSKMERQMAEQLDGVPSEVEPPKLSDRKKKMLKDLGYIH